MAGREFVARKTAASRCCRTRYGSLFFDAVANGTDLAFMPAARGSTDKDLNKKGETMKATFSAATFLTAVLGMAAAASAQSVVTPGLGFAGYGYGDYGYGYHSSTLEEGWLRGLGALAASQGQANYLNSLANINNQDAYTKYIQNRQKATDTYYYMRQTHRAYREAEAPQRFTREQYASLAKKAAPAPLTEAQYERTLGRIEWPAVLEGDEFKAERNALDRAFALRSPGDSGPSSVFYSNVHELTDSLQAKLKSKLGDLDAAQYVAAKKFLLSLAYESQRPMIAGAVAMAR